MATISTLAYLAASVLFILALRGLSHPETSRKGNQYGMIGMAVAIIATILNSGMDFGGFVLIVSGLAIGGSIGTVLANRIQMTSLPQLVAAFHSLVGLAAVFVAGAAFYSPESFGIGVVGDIKTASLLEMSLGLAIGAITFSGSVIAFLKLDGRMSGAPITFAGQHKLNAILGGVLVLLIFLFMLTGSPFLFWVIAILSFALGFLLIIPIGGADMPVVVSMLNSYSGWAAAGIGFTIGNLLLIVTGALVGASGAILSYIMCKGMNRSIINVLLGGFGSESGAAAAGGGGERAPVKAGSPEDAAFIMKNAQKIIVVPGYGMAVAQAQQVVREMADLLKKEGVEISYAIHPVAGRMPGHMNVLLAESDVPYEQLWEMDKINGDFKNTDVVIVVGANDVVNPAARESTGPIAGMPILDVDQARTVVVIKRSLAPGYAGIKNPLFELENCLMVFLDAKEALEGMVKEVKELK